MFMLVAGFVLPLLRSQLGLELAEALNLVGSVLHGHSYNVGVAVSCGSLPSHAACKHHNWHLCLPWWQLQNSRIDGQRLVLKLAIAQTDDGSIIMLHTRLVAGDQCL